MFDINLMNDLVEVTIMDEEMWRDLCYMFDQGMRKDYDWDSLWEDYKEQVAFDKDSIPTKKKLDELEPNLRNFMIIIDERREIFFDAYYSKRGKMKLAEYRFSK